MIRLNKYTIIVFILKWNNVKLSPPNQNEIQNTLSHTKHIHTHTHKNKQSNYFNILYYLVSFQTLAQYWKELKKQITIYNKNSCSFFLILFVV